MAGQSAHKAYLERRYFASLNGVRCLSVGVVLWHHSPLNDDISWPLLLERGFLGVDLFFVLSGFLITTLLLREEVRKGRFSIAGFYWRRALRILPIYFLLVTALAVYYVVIKGEAQYAPLIPYYYLFLANFLIEDIPLLAPTWSLSVEEQYYLIWPLVLLLTLNFSRARGWILLGAVVFFATAQQWGMWPGPIEGKYTVWALPGGAYEAVLMGSLLAIVLNSARGFAVVRKWLGGFWMASGLLVALLGLLQVLPTDLIGWPQSVVHLAMVLFLASLVVREDNALRSVLSFRPIARIGEISYGVYLYHLIGLDIATRLLSAAGVGQSLWISLLYVLVSIAMAEFSFRTLERFFLSFKRRGPDRPSAKKTLAP